jgi:lipopolysaccharide transport system ATP-binding protein
LKDVSFEIKQGEAVGIIGRNGAGKSTLLKLLSRITKPTKGRIEIEGRVASLLEVGTGFHAELTGRENIYLNGAIMGMPRAEIKKKFDEIVAFAEVEKFLDTPVKRYSSGMYMRLAFAVAAHLEPEILVVDEVLAVGDLQFQRKCMGKMEDISRGGRTVLFVSHNMDAILRMCSHSILLKNGSVEANCKSSQAVALYMATGTHQNRVIDLRQRPRPGNIFRSRARFTEIQMSHAEDTTGWTIPYGKQLSFEVCLQVTDSISDFVWGISIFTAAGLEITSNLSSHVLPLKTIEKGYYRFTARYAGLNLLPGIYLVGLGLRSAAGMEDYLRSGCEFEIQTSELSAKLQTDGFEGVLVPEVQFDLSPAGK